MCRMPFERAVTGSVGPQPIHHVEGLIERQSVHVCDRFRWVLQIGVNGYSQLPAGALHARGQGSLVTRIPQEPHDPELRPVASRLKSSSAVRSWLPSSTQITSYVALSPSCSSASRTGRSRSTKSGMTASSLYIGTITESWGDTPLSYHVQSRPGARNEPLGRCDVWTGLRGNHAQRRHEPGTGEDVERTLLFLAELELGRGPEQHGDHAVVARRSAHHAGVAVDMNAHLVLQGKSATWVHGGRTLRQFLVGAVQARASSRPSAADAIDRAPARMTSCATC